MALRSAALFAFTDQESQLVKDAATAMFTHREKMAHLGNEFFARVTFRIIHAPKPQLTPREAMMAVVEDMNSLWIRQKVQQAFDKVASRWTNGVVG